MAIHWGAQPANMWIIKPILKSWPGHIGNSTYDVQWENIIQLCKLPGLWAKEFHRSSLALANANWPQFSTPSTKNWNLGSVIPRSTLDLKAAPRRSCARWDQRPGSNSSKDGIWSPSLWLGGSTIVMPRYATTVATHSTGSSRSPTALPSGAHESWNHHSCSCLSVYPSPQKKREKQPQQIRDNPGTG